MANFYLITVRLIGGGTKRFEGRLNTLAGPDEDGRKQFQKLCDTSRKPRISASLRVGA